MQCRDEDLKLFYDKKIPLFRVHKYDGMLCTCKKVECQWVKLPDNTTRGSAGKHPAEDHGVNDARPCTDSTRFEGFNVGVACGRGIAVVDVDPRNGGLESLAALVAKHGELPRTPTASTGDGTHYYYAVVEQGIGKRIPGIDFIGVGGYVLAPSSLHPSQRHYEWVVDPQDCELAPMPQWIIDECCYKPREFVVRPGGGEAHPSDIYTSEDAAEAITFLDPNKDRDFWRDMGMSLKDGGFPFELWNDWAKTSKRHHGDADALYQWSTFKFGGGIGIGTFFFEAQKAGWSLKQTTESPILRRPPVEIPKETPPTHQDMDFPPGLAGVISEGIFNVATYKHKMFSISSALALISSAAQGAYRSPNGDGVLGSYQCLITDSGGGKGDYINPVLSILRKIHTELVLGEPASGQALRAEMHKCSSKVIWVDEIMKWVMKVLGAKDACMLLLQSDYLVAWSGGTIIGIATKEEINCSPEIPTPTLSVIGAGPLKSFQTMLRQGGSLADDGFLSRLDFIVANAPMPKTFIKTKPYDIPREILHRLQRIAKPIEKSEEKTFFGGLKKVKINRLVFDPKAIEWPKDVSDVWDEFAKECYLRAISTGLKPVWSRTAEKALRVASILAIIDNPDLPMVTLDGLEWAMRWHKRLSVDLELHCMEHLDKSDEQMARDILLKALRAAEGRVSGARVGRNSIGQWSRPWSKLDERVKMSAIESLERDGMIESNRSTSGRYAGAVTLALLPLGRESANMKK